MCWGLWRELQSRRTQGSLTSHAFKHVDIPSPGASSRMPLSQVPALGAFAEMSLEGWGEPTLAHYSVLSHSQPFPLSLPPLSLLAPRSIKFQAGAFAWGLPQQWDNFLCLCWSVWSIWLSPGAVPWWKMARRRTWCFFHCSFLLILLP